MFKLTPLPYPYDALEPVLSEETLKYHHDKHHRAYVDKLNELITDKQIEVESLDDLLLHASGEIYNNVGQIWNHDFYWAGLCAKAKKPAAHLSAAVAAQFGSMKDMQQQFNDAGLALFGAGWAWLVVDSSGKFSIFCGGNADNPRRHGLDPLLVCDVWEHAYYIDYRNDRKDYLSAYWDLVNWKVVAERYAQLSCSDDASAAGARAEITRRG